MTEVDSVITVVNVGDVALVTLDDGRVNALSLQRIEQLRTAIGAAAHDARAVVLAGRPGFYSAGLDLAVVELASIEERRQLRAAGIGLFQWMVRLPVPLVAACTGHAVAAGAMMLLVADLRIGPTRDCRIGLTEVALNVPISSFGMSLAVSRLGASAYRSTALATTHDSESARRAGFLDIVVTDPVDAAVEAAKQLAARSSGAAFARAKSMFYETCCVPTRSEQEDQP